MLGRLRDAVDGFDVPAEAVTVAKSVQVTLFVTTTDADLERVASGVAHAAMGAGFAVTGYDGVPDRS